jgi:antitoxin (DNA-binding transcriptional repressor) of toxin-antitoxin stability system
MSTVTLFEAQSHLAALLVRVQRGERILITERDGRAIAQLTPVSRAAAPRQSGMDEGRMWIAEDFDAPLQEDVLREFER